MEWDKGTVPNVPNVNEAGASHPADATAPAFTAKTENVSTPASEVSIPQTARDVNARRIGTKEPSPIYVCKKRTQHWLNGLGLQLPSFTTVLDPMSTISYQDGIVKIEGVPYQQYMQERSLPTVTGSSAKGGAQSDEKTSSKNSISRPAE